MNIVNGINPRAGAAPHRCGCNTGEAVSQWRGVTILHITFVNNINEQEDDDAEAKIIDATLRRDPAALPIGLPPADATIRCGR